MGCHAFAGPVEKLAIGRDTAKACHLTQASPVLPWHAYRIYTGRDTLGAMLSRVRWRNWPLGETPRKHAEASAAFVGIGGPAVGLLQALPRKRARIHG